jgi:hypothetical protein
MMFNSDRGASLQLAMIDVERTGTNAPREARVQ